MIVVNKLASVRCRAIGSAGADPAAALRRTFAELSSTRCEAGSESPPSSATSSDAAGDVDGLRRTRRQHPFAVACGRHDAGLGLLSLLDPGLPAGPPLRAGARRAVRCPSRGASLVQAGSLSQLVSPWPRRLGQDSRAILRSSASRIFSASKERKSTRSPSGPFTLASSNRGTSASSATARRSFTWRSRWATSTAGSSGH